MKGGLLGLIKQQQNTVEVATIADGLLLQARQQQDPKSQPRSDRHDKQVIEASDTDTGEADVRALTSGAPGSNEMQRSFHDASKAHCDSNRPQSHSQSELQTQGTRVNPASPLAAVPAAPFLDLKAVNNGAWAATQTPAVPPATIFDDLRGAHSRQHGCLAGVLCRDGPACAAASSFEPRDDQRQAQLQAHDQHQHQQPQQHQNQQGSGSDEMLAVLTRVLAQTQSDNPPQVRPQQTAASDCSINT